MVTLHVRLPLCTNRKLKNQNEWSFLPHTVFIHYKFLLTLVVLMELEGLMKGSTRTDSPAEGAR